VKYTPPGKQPHTAFLTVRIARQHNPATVARRQVNRLFWIHLGFTLGEGMHANHPKAAHLGAETNH
jgi:hypothetical protein